MVWNYPPLQIVVSGNNDPVHSVVFLLIANGQLRAWLVVLWINFCKVSALFHPVRGVSVLVSSDLRFRAHEAPWWQHHTWLPIAYFFCWHCAYVELLFVHPWTVLFIFSSHQYKWGRFWRLRGADIALLQIFFDE